MLFQLFVESQLLFESQLLLKYKLARGLSYPRTVLVLSIMPICTQIRVSIKPVQQLI